MKQTEQYSRSGKRSFSICSELQIKSSSDSEASGGEGQEQKFNSFDDDEVCKIIAESQIREEIQQWSCSR